MASDKSQEACPYCGKSQPLVIGVCKVCSLFVCMNCGNKQITQSYGRIAIHNHCFNKNPSMVSSSFRFIKIKGSS